MAITNNKVEKPIIPIPDAQDKLTTKVKIFIWESCRRIGISDRKYEQSVQDAYFECQSNFGLVNIFLDYNWDE